MRHGKLREVHVENTVDVFRRTARCYDAASSSYYTAPMMLNDKLAGTGRPSPKQFPGMIRKPHENVKVSVNTGWDSNPATPEYTSQALSLHQRAGNSKFVQKYIAPTWQSDDMRTWRFRVATADKSVSFSHTSLLSNLAALMSVIISLSSSRAVWTAASVASIHSFTETSLSPLWRESGWGWFVLPVLPRELISHNQVRKQTFADVPVVFYQSVRACVSLLAIVSSKVRCRINGQRMHEGRGTRICLCTMITSQRQHYPSYLQVFTATNFQYQLFYICIPVLAIYCTRCYSWQLSGCPPQEVLTLSTYYSGQEAGACKHTNAASGSNKTRVIYFTNYAAISFSVTLLNTVRCGCFG